MAAAIKSEPPWRLALLSYNRLGLLTPAERKELRDLEAEARDETLRRLGPSYLDRSGRIAAKYAFVTPDKAVLLDALLSDYDNLRQQSKDETRNLRTPADVQREKFLTAEQERDLAALLTPAERDGYELRASPTALKDQFQRRIATFQPTEAEYRALFAVQKAADAATGAGLPNPQRGVVAGAPGATMVMVSGGHSELPEPQVRAALGDTRFAEWKLAGQPYYQALVEVMRSQQLPADTARQLGLAVSDALATSWRIAEDATLPGPQKKAALAQLAADVRTQLEKGIGTGPAEAFLRTARWFDSLSAGTAVQIDGNTMSLRLIDPPPRPQPTTPPPGRK